MFDDYQRFEGDSPGATIQTTETRSIVIFKDEEIVDLMSRLKFVLIELGIKVTLVESDEDCNVYTLSHAERLA